MRAIAGRDCREEPAGARSTVTPCSASCAGKWAPAARSGKDASYSTTWPPHTTRCRASRRLVSARASRSLAHVFTLLGLVLPPEPMRVAFAGLHAADQRLGERRSSISMRCSRQTSTTGCGRFWRTTDTREGRHGLGTRSSPNSCARTSPSPSTCGNRGSHVRSSRGRADGLEGRLRIRGGETAVGAAGRAAPAQVVAFSADRPVRRARRWRQERGGSAPQRVDGPPGHRQPRVRRAFGRRARAATLLALLAGAPAARPDWLVHERVVLGPARQPRHPEDNAHRLRFGSRPDCRRSNARWRQTARWS